MKENEYEYGCDCDELSEDEASSLDEFWDNVDASKQNAKETMKYAQMKKESKER